MGSYFSWLIPACGLVCVVACLFIVSRKPSLKILSRCAGFLLLAAALGCAFTNEFGEWAIGKPHRIIVVLDRSASMGATTKEGSSLLEQAIAHIKSSIGKNPRAEWILLDSATKSQLPVDSLDGLESTETAANFPELILLASNIAETQHTTDSEIWIFSDMQESNWTFNRNKRHSAKEPFPLPPIRVISLRERPSSNFAVRIDSSSILDGNLVLSFSISQDGIPRAISLPISIQTGEKTRAETILLEPKKATRIERIIPLPAETNSGFGKVSIAFDNAPVDNAAYFAFAAQHQPRVTIACQSRQVTETLKNMVAPPGMKEITASFYRPWNSAQLKLDDQSLLIWQGIPPNAKQKEEIDSFMKKGGYTLFMPDRNQTKPLSLWNGLRWLSPDTKSSEEPFSISPVVQNRGILKNGKDQTPLPFHHIKSIRKIPCDGEELRTLARWDDGTDAILSKPIGKGGMIICTTLPLYSWSNLADGSILIPIIHRLAAMGTRTQTGTFSFPVGSAKLPSITGSQMVCLLPPNHHSQSPFIHAGVFQTGDSIFCTNRPMREDEPKPISPEHLASLLPNTPISEYPLAQMKKTHSFLIVPWWYWGAMSILLLVIPEFSFLRKK